MNLTQGAALFAGMAFAYEKHMHDSLDGAGKIVQDEAKRVIGSYELGWTPLAASTQEDRVRKGFPANEPLLRTGEMRDSIERTVQGKSAFVGSNDDKAVWQELGTSRGIPPRSFLGGAAKAKGPEVAKHLGNSVHSLLRGDVNRSGGYNVGGLYVGK